MEKKQISKKELEKLYEIAENHIPELRGRGNLDTKNNDSDDFFETAVWSLKDALIEAYKLGQSAASNE